ncbi:TRAP transporter small permease [Vibrio sp. DNB22_10_4]
MMKIILETINERIEEWVITLLLANIVILIFVQVCMRYVFNSSLSWSEELVTWSFIWFIWVGVSYGFKTRKHICVTAFVDLLPQRAKVILNILVSVIILWFMLHILHLGIKQMTSPFISRQLSVVLYYPFTDTQVSMKWLYASLPFGALLSSYRIAQNILAEIKELCLAKVSKEVCQ